MDALRVINGDVSARVPASGREAIASWVEVAGTLLLQRLQVERQAQRRREETPSAWRFQKSEHTASEWRRIVRVLNPPPPAPPIPSPLAVLEEQQKTVRAEGEARRALAKELGWAGFPVRQGDALSVEARAILLRLESNLRASWIRPLRRCELPIKGTNTRCHRFYWGQRHGRGAECPDCRRKTGTGSSRTSRFYARERDSVAIAYRQAKDRLKHRDETLSKRTIDLTLKAYAKIIEAHRQRPRSLASILAAFDAATPKATVGRPRKAR